MMVGVVAIVRVILSCLAVCGLVWGFGQWMRRQQPLPGRAARRLRMIESLPLGTGKAVFLIACHERRFLVGAAGDRIELLAELAAAENDSGIADAGTASSAAPQSPPWSASAVSLLLIAILLAVPHAACAQTAKAGALAGQLSLGRESVQTLMLLTLIAMAPFLLAVMTCFTRVIIVLSLLRMGLGTPQTPPNPVLVGMALFLTLFVMGPTFQEANATAVQPYLKGQMTTEQVVEAGLKPFRRFMLRQTREQDLGLFLRIAKLPNPKRAEDLPTRIVIPAFILSEVRTGFEIGFLVALPFMVVDVVVASVLMGMGMLMVPPMLISLPFKLLLFVLSDGWALLLRGLAMGVR